ncbi:MAG: T9SS type A sorting domain-containing protein [Bacteroidetes bacterium]|nr:T9SS type A sorting domain-containing protein [Bacteroidota bacterium]
MKSYSNVCMRVAALLLMILWTLPSQAQHVCGTEDRETFLSRMQPEERVMYEQLERQVQEFVLSKAGEVQNNPLWKAHRYDTVKYVIPCVVHVVHDVNNPSTPDSVVARIILEQMNYGLHRDFRALPGTLGYGHKAVDMQIEFNLASIDPNGDPTNGIVYHAHNTHSSVSQSSSAAMKQAYNWDQTKYFNIWLVREITDGGGSFILGFARFPVQTGTPYTDDGIVVRYNNFSATGDYSERSYGRTATHEIGHWMNLYHTFQSGCVGGDLVADTPPEGSDPIYGTCTRRYNRCNNDNPDLPENNKNYMGYLDDLGVNHFTVGQRNRAHAVFETASYGQRYPLWQDGNLQATGTGPYKAPVIADFYVSNRYTCPGEPVTFYDYSMGKPHAWEWSFPTADAGFQSSTERTPTVYFSTPGAHSAYLKVTNQGGTKDTTIEGIVVVRNIAPKSLPYAISFETSETAEYYFSNPDSGIVGLRGIAWETTALGGYESSRCARMNHSIYCEYHARDGVVLPPVDLSDDSQTDASIAFSWSYVPYFFSDASAQGRVYTDSLAILASTDCGHTWTRVHQLGGIEMSVTGNFTNVSGTFNFYGNNWRRDTISLNQFLGEDNLQLKVEAINGYGNDLFLDAISVDYVQGNPGILPGVVSRHRPRQLASARLAPNPVTDHTHLYLDLANGQKTSLQVMDASGRLVQQVQYGQLAAGSHTLEVNLHSQPAGIYLVRLRTDDGEKTFKAIKH